MCCQLWQNFIPTFVSVLLTASSIKIIYFSEKTFDVPLEIVNLYLALSKGTSRLSERRFCWFQVHRTSVHMFRHKFNYQDLKWQTSTSVTPVWQFLNHSLLLKKQQFWVFLDQHCSFIFLRCLIEGPFWFGFLFFQCLCKYEASLSTVRHIPLS